MWPLINSWEERVDPFRELERLHRQFNGGAGSRSRFSTEYPPLNVRGNAETVYVSAELPGIDPSKLDLTVTGNALTIAGERSPETIDENDVVYRSERPSGRFNRTVRLPYDVDNDQIGARYEKGVLTITLPRSEATKPRKIQVQS